MEKKYSCKSFEPFQEKVRMAYCGTCKKFTDCYDWVNHIYRLYEKR